MTLYFGVPHINLLNNNIYNQQETFTVYVLLKKSLHSDKVVFRNNNFDVCVKERESRIAGSDNSTQWIIMTESAYNEIYGIVKKPKRTIYHKKANQVKKHHATR